MEADADDTQREGIQDAIQQVKIFANQYRGASDVSNEFDDIMEEIAAAVKELELKSNDDVQTLEIENMVDGWVAFENTEVCKHSVHDEVEENMRH